LTEGGEFAGDGAEVAGGCFGMPMGLCGLCIDRIVENSGGDDRQQDRPNQDAEVRRGEAWRASVGVSTGPLSAMLILPKTRELDGSAYVPRM
jgi:hypothetical protein